MFLKSNHSWSQNMTTFLILVFFSIQDTENLSPQNCRYDLLAFVVVDLKKQQLIIEYARYVKRTCSRIVSVGSWRVITSHFLYYIFWVTILIVIVFRKNLILAQITSKDLSNTGCNSAAHIGHKALLLHWLLT